MFQRYVMRAESVWDASAGYRIVDLHRSSRDGLAYVKEAESAQRIVDLLNADDERQRIGKIVQAREVLGSEIVDIVNLSPAG